MQNEGNAILGGTMSRDDFYFHVWELQAIFTGIKQNPDYYPVRSVKYKQLAIKYYYDSFVAEAKKMSYEQIIHEVVSFGNIYFDELEFDARDND